MRRSERIGTISTNEFRGQQSVDKKSSLIASNDSRSELSRSFERALRYLLDEKYDIQKTSYEKSYSIYSDILLILDINPQDSSYTYGIHFLRTYWAENINKNKDSPPVVLFSFNSLKDLIGKEHMNIVACSENISLRTIPCSLKNIKEDIQKVIKKKIDLKTQKKFLRWSCGIDVGTTSEHAIKNYSGPYSLLIGAYYSDEISKETLLNTIGELQARETSKELRICFAAIKPEVDYGPKEPTGNVIHETLKDKRVLLIDDEHETAGWEKTFKIIFRDSCGLTAVGEELIDKETGEINPVEIKKHLTPHDNHILPYDLIFLDLYLIKGENEKIDGTKEAYKFSGIRLLNEIRRNDPTVPVILFTASNKAFNRDYHG